MDTLFIIAVAAIPVIFAIVLHEVAHGWVASKFGDNTARQMGRLTLNPLKHIDPIGTILVPVMMVILLGFAFGWAKPVPVNFRNLYRPKHDMVYVAAAGPAANLLMLVFWGLIAKLSLMLGNGLPASILFLMSSFGIGVNLVLMLLNLIPLPPLDGGRIAVGLLPMQFAAPLAQLERYGLFILVGILLLLTQIYSQQTNAFLSSLITSVRSLFGIT